MYNFSPLIEEKFREFNIEEEHFDYCYMYLLSIFFGLKVEIPEPIVRKVNITKIVDRDYEKKTVKWNINLFGTTTQLEEDQRWEWVDKEYRELFKSVKNDKAGDKRGCITKMKKFFAANPDIRKEDIINAANLYLAKFKAGTENCKYLQQADYFISKVVEGSKKSRLEQYLEIVKSDEQKSSGNNQRFNVIS